MLLYKEHLSSDRCNLLPWNLLWTLCYSEPYVWSYCSTSVEFVSYMLLKRMERNWEVKRNEICKWRVSQNLHFLLIMLGDKFFCYFTVLYGIPFSNTTIVKKWKSWKNIHTYIFCSVRFAPRILCTEILIDYVVHEYNVISQNFIFFLIWKTRCVPVYLFIHNNILYVVYASCHRNSYQAQRTALI
jgi:hypothetical protein